MDIVARAVATHIRSRHHRGVAVSALFLPTRELWHDLCDITLLGI
jgi:hypothetical protein